ncbi:hypothetical protein ACFL1X_04020 [Candidatus Hydrogenedentota bacterium]
MPDIGAISDLLSAAGFDDITVHRCTIDGVVKDAPEDYFDKRNRDGDSTSLFLTTTEIEEYLRVIDMSCWESYTGTGKIVK